MTELYLERRLHYLLIFTVVALREGGHTQKREMQLSVCFHGALTGSPLFPKNITRPGKRSIGPYSGFFLSFVFRCVLVWNEHYKMCERFLYAFYYGGALEVLKYIFIIRLMVCSIKCVTLYISVLRIKTTFPVVKVKQSFIPIF